MVMLRPSGALRAMKAAKIPDEKIDVERLVSWMSDSKTRAREYAQSLETVRDEVRQLNLVRTELLPYVTPLGEEAAELVELFCS